MLFSQRSSSFPRLLVCILLTSLPGLLSTTIAWQLQPEATAANQQEHCILSSEVLTIHDGYDQTRVGIRIKQGTIFVYTTSPLDASFADLGLQVDQFPFISGDTVVGQKTLLFDTAYASLIEQFKKGRQVRIQLRFWPTWPATGTRDAILSLKGFRKAYEALLACE